MSFFSQNRFWRTIYVFWRTIYVPGGVPEVNRNFDRLNQGIAGIKGSMVIASYYGVDASIGTNDATTLLKGGCSQSKVVH
jgi:hypothetical protein